MSFVRYRQRVPLSAFQHLSGHAPGRPVDHPAAEAPAQWMPSIDVREEAARFVIVAEGRVELVFGFLALADLGDHELDELGVAVVERHVLDRWLRLVAGPVCLTGRAVSVAARAAGRQRN